MDKVILPKEVAEAFELASKLPEFRYDNMSFVKAHVEAISDGEEWAGPFEPLNNLEFDDFINALYNGYEVEQTPEDKVRYEVSKWSGLANDATDREDTCTANYWHAKVDATKKILDILNMQIKGVNA